MMFFRYKCFWNHDYFLWQISKCVLFSIFKGAITFYTALIFEEADTIVDPNDCALIIGVSYFLSSILGLVLKKHVGRRILLLMSELGMAISQIAMGIYFYILNDVRLAWQFLVNLVV